MTALIVGFYLVAFFTLVGMHLRTLQLLRRALRKQRNLRSALHQVTNDLDLICGLHLAKNQDEAAGVLARYEVRQAGDIDAELDQLLRTEGGAS